MAAMAELSTLRNRLPGAKAGEVLDVFDRIEKVWLKQDPSAFPFNILTRRIEDIKSEVSDAFAGELNQEVDLGSPIFEQLVDIDIRARIYSEIAYLYPVYDGLERRLQQIEAVLPPKVFAVESSLNELPEQFESFRKRLEKGSQLFRGEEYEQVLRECGRAEGWLFTRFRQFLEENGIGSLPTNIGPALGKIRESFRAPPSHGTGFSVRKSGRLERLVLSMFETLHYFRNLEAHDDEEEINTAGLPEWQIQRRAYCKNEPEYARLAMFLALQIALELSALIEERGAQ